MSAQRVWLLLGDHACSGLVSREPHPCGGVRGTFWKGPRENCHGICAAVWASLAGVATPGTEAGMEVFAGEYPAAAATMETHFEKSFLIKPWH